MVAVIAALVRTVSALVMIVAALGRTVAALAMTVASLVMTVAALVMTIAALVMMISTVQVVVTSLVARYVGSVEMVVLGLRPSTIIILGQRMEGLTLNLLLRAITILVFICLINAVQVLPLPACQPQVRETELLLLQHQVSGVRPDKLYRLLCGRVKEPAPVNMKDVRSWSTTTAGDVDTVEDDLEEFKEGDIYTIEEAQPKP